MHCQTGEPERTVRWVHGPPGSRGTRPTSFDPSIVEALQCQCPEVGSQRISSVQTILAGSFAVPGFSACGDVGSP